MDIIFLLKIICITSISFVYYTHWCIFYCSIFYLRQFQVYANQYLQLIVEREFIRYLNRHFECFIVRKEFYLRLNYYFQNYNNTMHLKMKTFYWLVEIYKMLNFHQIFCYLSFPFYFDLSFFFYYYHLFQFLFPFFNFFPVNC